MKRRVIATVLALTMLAASVTAGCGNQADEPIVVTPNSPASGSGQDKDTASNDASTDEGVLDNTASASEENARTADSESDSIQPVHDFLLGTSEPVYYDKDLVPSVTPYTVKEDFSNVKVADRFLYNFGLDSRYDSKEGEKLRKALARNLFAIKGDMGASEFFDIYESNRYSQFPSFITVDSLMHTYHLYFAYLMKCTEKQFVGPELKKLSASMIQASAEQYEQLKGTKWEKAALRNLAFFCIGGLLQDDSLTLPLSDASFSAIIDSEIKKIMDAGGIDTCELTGKYEDYSQYKPRGYYEGDEQQEKYFRSMMWYGRIPFETSDEESVKSAILMSLAIDAAGKDSWEAIYKITAFFAGASDDPGYQQLMPIITEAYGKTPGTSELDGNDDAVAKVITYLSKLEPPKINSIPVEDGDEPVIPSFRFMGQRFTIDSAIMQRLVYSAIKENGKGEKRFLPDTLDVAATLGSEKALEILKDSGAAEYEGYSDNMAVLKDIYTKDDPTLWNASLYSGWLGTLRPLFEKKGEGYPSFMQSDEWAKKNLETFAGSYAELKHDTILYSKQLMAEMGDGEDEEVLDDRGYVEPEPVVYSRFIFLADSTKAGLSSYGMLPDGADTDLDRLSVIGHTLLTISEKELKEEPLTDDEYEFIRAYGGDIEHFWYEAMKDSVDDLVYSYQAKCPVIADIATDPNGTVLEVGTGDAQEIYVVFPIDGELHVGRGSAYSFYQFETSIGNRLTDSQWREKLEGGHFDDDWNWVKSDDAPVQPDWTLSYRVGTD